MSTPETGAGTPVKKQAQKAAPAKRAASSSKRATASESSRAEETASGATATEATTTDAAATEATATDAAPEERAPRGGSSKKKVNAGKARPRLKVRYDTEVRSNLVETLGLSNVMEAPRLEKIVVNMGVGRATQQPSLIEGAVRDLEVITGQKPLVTRARRSIAQFKLREGQNIGVKVTMRGDRAWEFLDRLIALAIPRIRDFRGLSPNSFDGRGNYTFGVNEQLIFPEVDYDRVDTTRGMDITICTTARTDEQGRAFLVAFGFPFRQEAA